MLTSVENKKDRGQEVSLVHGPQSPPLRNKTIGQLTREQAVKWGEREAVIVPWQSTRLTYGQLEERSALVAKSLLAAGIKRGDCLGIIAGNCYQYIDVFLGGGRIGCSVAVMNKTFSPAELQSAVVRAGQPPPPQSSTQGLQKKMHLTSKGTSRLQGSLHCSANWIKRPSSAYPNHTRCPSRENSCPAVGDNSQFYVAQANSCRLEPYLSNLLRFPQSWTVDFHKRPLLEQSGTLGVTQRCVESPVYVR